MSSERHFLDSSAVQEGESPSEHPTPQPQTPHGPLRHSQEVEFEKNYPKNIFIPLIEYLTELGYREAFEKSVGCRSEFEGKNVVSLDLIHRLISQDWFLRNINKQLALGHISNKILLNSKIKKKLFHLLIAHLILSTDFIDSKDFKRKVSKEANIISKKYQQNDDIFSYPNAIIYLLHLFRKTLLFHANKKGYNKLEEDLEKMSLEEASVLEAKPKTLGSKEEYKFYVKEIVHIFSSKGIANQNYADILEEVRQTILEKDRLFREKYRLVEGIPNWSYFIECVVMRCFQLKKKDCKITNFVFNEWITECKNKMLSIIQARNSEHQLNQIQQKEQSKGEGWFQQRLQFHDMWSAVPMPLIPQDKAQCKEASQLKAATVKEFKPIILSKSFS